jgi:hypothetical protein
VSSNGYGFHTLLERERNGDQPVGLDARRPKEVIDLHGSERDGLDRVIARGFLGLQTNGNRGAGAQK